MSLLTGNDAEQKVSVRTVDKERHPFSPKRSQKHFKKKFGLLFIVAFKHTFQFVVHFRQLGIRVV